MSTVFGEIHFSEISKNLLSRLRTRELAIGEFLRECAYWAIREGFDELMPLFLPTSPTTQAFMEYEAILPERRRRIDYDFFLKNPEINEYYQQVKFVCNRNQAIVEWLKEIRDYLLPDDFILLKKIDDRLLEFTAFFDDNSILVEKIKFIFQAKET